MSACASLLEISSNVQGEGPYVGYPMTFVRFFDCALSCKFCDTLHAVELSPYFHLEVPAGSGHFILKTNPASGPDLTDYLNLFPSKMISLTGGEPLQQAEFLRHFLPGIKTGRSILLETSGVFYSELERVIEHIDIVSMDIKLPSVTGMRGYWDEHAKFLAMASTKKVYVKVVVSDSLKWEELQRAINLVRDIAPQTPFILQPVTPIRSSIKRPLEDALKKMYQASKDSLEDVQVIPQMHTLLGLR